MVDLINIAKEYFGGVLRPEKLSLTSFILLPGGVSRPCRGGGEGYKWDFSCQTSHVRVSHDSCPPPHAPRPSRPPCLRHGDALLHAGGHRRADGAVRELPLPAQAAWGGECSAPLRSKEWEAASLFFKTHCTLSTESIAGAIQPASQQLFPFP